MVFIILFYSFRVNYFWKFFQHKWLDNFPPPFFRYFGILPPPSPPLPFFSSLFQGALGGALGAGFIILNKQIVLFRQKHLQSKMARMMEVVLLCVVTTSLQFVFLFFFLFSFCFFLNNPPFPGSLSLIIFRIVIVVKYLRMDLPF